MNKRTKNLLTIIGPGILVAATGVGAGDLGTAAFTGVKLGVALMWAVVLGAFLKFVLNEGLTRWQLGTGQTLLEGCLTHLGPVFRWVFLLYLVIWSFFVGLALMSACGATWHAIYPILENAQSDKVLYGAIHSAVAVVLVLLGGYQLFEKIMAVCIAIMFADVVITAVALRPDVGEIFAGLFVPRIPQFDGVGLDWAIALIGGVGGTLTILCYGYWIREENRSGEEAISVCRIDLGIGYTMTALFGMSILVIGSRLDQLDSRGVTILLEMSNELEAAFGSFGGLAKWAFLLGAWGAVFSSLLGVWQSIPYLFADFWERSGKSKDDTTPYQVDTQSWAYRGYLIALGIVPTIGLYTVPFQQATKVNAIIGAMVVPFLAGILLYLNNRKDLMPVQFRNSWRSNIVLVLTLCFSVVAGYMTIRAKLFG